MSNSATTPARNSNNATTTNNNNNKKNAPLQLGAVYATFAELQKAIVRFNQSRQRSFLVSASSISHKANRHYYRVRCPTYDQTDDKSCQWHVFGMPASKQNVHVSAPWRIGKCNLNHSCQPQQDNNDNANQQPHKVGRLKNYKQSILEASNPWMATFVPDPNNPKPGYQQLMDQLAQDSQNDMVLSKAQAQKILRRLQSQQPGLDVHLGQFSLVHSYVEKLRAEDPEGSFHYETTATATGVHNRNGTTTAAQAQTSPTSPQFDRVYVCFSLSKRQWANDGTVRVLFANDTCAQNHSVCLRLTRLLLALTYNGQGDVVVLAYAFVPERSRCGGDTDSDDDDDNYWTWFLQCLQGDFPGFRVFMADQTKDKTDGFHALLASQQQQLSRCVQHMMDVDLSQWCKSHKLGKIPPVVVHRIFLLAKARSREEYTAHLEWLRTSSGRLRPIADWWHERRHQFATHLFLQDDCPRHGRIVNTAPVDALLASTGFTDMCKLPILQFMLELNVWILQKRHGWHDMATNLLENKKAWTSYAEEKMLELDEQAKLYNVKIVGSCSDESSVISAMVCKKVAAAATMSAWFTVAVNVNEKSIDCPCKFSQEMLFPCCHGRAVILEAASKSNTNNTNLVDPSHPDWLPRLFHSQVLLSSNACTRPPCTDFTTGRSLSVQVTIPPEASEQRRHVGGSARKKKSKDHDDDDDDDDDSDSDGGGGGAVQSNNKHPRVCYLCGKQGHQGRACPHPSMVYIWNRFQDDALKYASKTAQSCSTVAYTDY